jgi:peptidoglycan/LPS O-acetylase OafA/YrhL
MVEHEARRFSLVKFYERRARRIFPALFAMVIISILLAFYIMLPSAYYDFLKSVRAVVVFVSNFYFSRNLGYFDVSAERSPLIHTWSLGVEEQFYIFFPLVFTFFNNRFPQKLKYLFVALIIISLLISEVGWRIFPVANFYLLPSRIWELMAGALCSVIIDERKRKNLDQAVAIYHQLFYDVMSFFGLFCVVGSILFMGSGAIRQTSEILIPVIGSVLIILFANPRTYVARLISLSKFLVEMNCRPHEIFYFLCVDTLKMLLSSHQHPQHCYM